MMRWMRVFFPCVSACCVSLLIGCQATKKAPTKVSQPNPPSPTMSNVDARVSELRKRSQEFAESASQLPGTGTFTPAERKKVADAFEKGSSALALLGGPTPGGSFRQELRIIDNTRRFLAEGNGDLSPIPATDSGLRSLQNALSNVRERLFPADDKVRDQMDALRARVAALDQVRGPMHATAVSEAFTAASTVIDSMSAGLDSRLSAALAPPTATPASAAVPPTTR